MQSCVLLFRTTFQNFRPELKVGLFVQEAHAQGVQERLMRARAVQAGLSLIFTESRAVNCQLFLGQSTQSSLIRDRHEEHAQ